MGIFATNAASLTLPDGVKLAADMPLSAVEQSGIVFVRQITMKTGWAYRTTGAFVVAGHTVYFALGFKDDRLRSVAFAFTDLHDEPLSAQRDAHDRYLAAALGLPTVKTVAYTRYDFRWGDITSTTDLRTDQAKIVMSWT